MKSNIIYRPLYSDSKCIPNVDYDFVFSYEAWEKRFEKIRNKCKIEKEKEKLV